MGERLVSTEHRIITLDSDEEFVSEESSIISKVKVDMHQYQLSVDVINFKEINVDSSRPNVYIFDGFSCPMGILQNVKIQFLLDLNAHFIRKNT